MSIENVSLDAPARPGRRDFLIAGGGLTLAFLLPERGAAAADEMSENASVFAPNAFIRIGSDNTVTVISKHLEMGQGSYTGLATLLAEELDADWAQVRVEGAPADARRYNNLSWGPMQGTGGSSSIANSFMQMRQAGAAARAMLLAAAAKHWQADPAQLNVKAGVVSDPASGRRMSFGELANAAAKEPVPATDGLRLKEAKDFVLIGHSVPRKDTPAKTQGSAVFTSDIRRPGMLVAVVLHAPRFGARVGRVDERAARKLAGVVDVIALPNAVAVLANDFWTAKKGRDALKVEWDEKDAFHGSSGEILAEYRRLAGQPGKSARLDGDPQSGLERASRRIEAVYELPYLAHASMEPLDCVVELSPGHCEVWNGEQSQTPDQAALAALLGIPRENVKINMLFAGGSFGRRSNTFSDYLVEAARIARARAERKEAEGRASIKLVWTREDDMRAGFYRPAYVHRLLGGVDAQGQPVAWQHRIVGQSILAGTAMEKSIKNGIDSSSVEGAANLPYAIPDLGVELTTTATQVPVLWWRAVGSTHTAFACEVFLDELAQLGAQDPVAVREKLLGKHPRHLETLRLVAQKAAWGTPLAPGKAGERRGRGIALHESFRSVVALVAEVTVQVDGRFRVDRVVCAVDCGIAVNPDIVRSQMEGGIGYGLSAALSGAITLKDGRVEQGNFDTYPVLRMHEMPQIEVHIVPSQAAPTGVGEPATPVIAPAVANALFAATGRRLRRLPFDTTLLRA